jgi:RNA polymerase sigma-70 factor (ECF subfamily)
MAGRVDGETAESLPSRANPYEKVTRNVRGAKVSVLPPDAEMVDRLRSGDTRALELLVGAYWEPLARYAEGILERCDGGDDVAQEVFIRLWTRRGGLRREGSLRAFLYATARNAAIDDTRRERRHAARAALADPPIACASPLDSAEEAELAGRAAAVVAALPPRRREVFRLVREGGMSYEDVAAVMGISSQTVANHMSLALATLRAALGGRASQRMVEPAARRRAMGG